MGKPQGLVLKKNSYFYVRRIPENLRALFGDKQQLTIPLGTRDPRVAAERARAKATETDIAFQQAKLGISPRPAPAPSKTSLNQIETAARLYLYECEQDYEDDIHDPHTEDALTGWLGNLYEPPDSWGGSIQTTANKLVAKYNLSLASGDALWFEFVNLIHRAELEHVRRRLDRLRNAHSFRIHDRFFTEVHDGVAKPTIENQEGETLADVIKRFELDPHRQHLTVSAAKKYIIPFAALREVVGDEAVLKSITRAQCAHIIDLIASLPANYTKYKEFKGKTFREIAAIAKERSHALLSRGTVEVYAHHLSAFFNFAVHKGICEINPATKLTPKLGKQSSKRLPFNSVELNGISNGLLAWSEQSPGRYWLPVIALFSGMRLGEIIWLRQSDIRDVDGVLCFVLTKTHDRSLKTEGSERVIPVHPTLLDLGFRDFVQAQKAENGRLFVDLPGRDQKQAVDLFQKRFSYWLKQHLKVREGVSFHSFRHTFRDATRAAELPIDAVRALGGWGRGSSIEERYGQGARPSTLAKWIAKITYPEVDLSPLKK